MIQFQFFPRSQGITLQIKSIIDCFEKVNNKIDSDHNSLNSDAVLKELAEPLTQIGFKVETSKAKNDKIDVPVLFGVNDQIDKCFNADALSDDGTIVIEVEAGRATENNQFLKDIFQACMMFGVEYLAIAVRNTYRTHKDFQIIYTFLETLYISNRMHLPLKGILLIGY
jgi:hypothetical protein